MIQMIISQSESDDNRAYRFPVSLKGVLLRDRKVALLKNPRDEWELPGGKLELYEEPKSCLAREIAEELSLKVDIGRLLDTWVYSISKNVHVFIVTYQCFETSHEAVKISHEHKEFAWHDIKDLSTLTMPEGYKQSIHNALSAI